MVMAKESVSDTLAKSSQCSVHEMTAWKPTYGKSTSVIKSLLVKRDSWPPTIAGAKAAGKTTSSVEGP